MDFGKNQMIVSNKLYLIIFLLPKYKINDKICKAPEVIRLQNILLRRQYIL